MFQEKTNLEIEERKATLDAKIKEQQILNDSYRREVEQKVREEFENEYQEKREWIQKKNTEQYRISEQLQKERQINENLRERAVLSQILIKTWQSHSLDAIILLERKIAQRQCHLQGLFGHVLTSSKTLDLEDSLSLLPMTSIRVLDGFSASPSDDFTPRYCSDI
ncbi:hypothetical protein L1D41_18800 [Vibrio harveyi]|uniref:hypothetical protein n=1 Tax=Vibrio TaxID=662 RepID=UPI001EFD0AD6|nr:hypothetical protein [Vibrio harveyi]MCG9611688.1 hypothetical protein [Vibrio harveyi]MCG9669795.1 hypothetical protein [Vibrio harveyi]